MKLTFFVPEPSRWLLLAAGLGCLVSVRTVVGGSGGLAIR